jgi:hypothetical protein
MGEAVAPLRNEPRGEPGCRSSAFAADAESNAPVFLNDVNGSGLLQAVLPQEHDSGQASWLRISRSLPQDVQT